MEFDKSNGLYRNSNRYLSRAEVQVEVGRISRYVQKEIASATTKLFADEITLADWQIRMSELIRTGNVLSGAIGFGGFEQMTAARWGKIGSILKRQYQYLNEFARQIEQGRVILASQATHRAQLYSHSIRATYYLGETAVVKAAGFTLSMRVLHAMESCSQCLDWAGRGFVPIDEQPEIGRLKCRHFCRCTLDYK